MNVTADYSHDQGHSKLNTHEGVKERNILPISSISFSNKNVFTISDHSDMLILAQQKFDDMRRRSRELTRSKYSRSHRRGLGIDPDKIKNNQLLSSLLYLTLMTHKVDAMKKMLEQRDSLMYKEWHLLFQSLHSPIFYLKERRIQNDRVKNIFKRKALYKDKFVESKKQLDKAYDSIQQMSHSIASLTNENEKNSQLVKEKCDLENQLESERKDLVMLQEYKEMAEKRIDNLNTEKSQLEDKLNNIKNVMEKDLAKEQKETELLREQVSKLERQVDTIFSERNVLESENENLLIDVAKFSQKIEDIEVSSSRDIELVNELKSDIKLKQDEVINLREKLERITKEYTDSNSEVHDKLTAVKQKLTESVFLCKETEKKLSVTTNELESLRSKYDEDITSSKLECSTNRTNLETTRVELEYTKKTLESKQKDLESKENILAEMNESNVLMERRHHQELRDIRESKDKEIHLLKVRILELEKEHDFIRKNTNVSESKLLENINSIESRLRLSKEETMDAKNEIEKMRIEFDAKMTHKEEIEMNLKSELYSTRQELQLAREEMNVMKSASLVVAPTIATKTDSSCSSKKVIQNEDNISVNSNMQSSIDNTKVLMKVIHDEACLLTNTVIEAAQNNVILRCSY